MESNIKRRRVNKINSTPPKTMLTGLLAISLFKDKLAFSPNIYFDSWQRKSFHLGTKHFFHGKA